MTQPNSTNPTFPSGVGIFVPDSKEVPRYIFGPGLLPFASETIAFCNAVSKRILLSRDFRHFPEMLAFAHWLRKASILQLSKQFAARHADSRQPRGMAFHIAPKNVDTIFLYSLFLALLAGNTNIVRISSSQTQQVSMVLGAINAVLRDEQFQNISDRICIVGYEHDETVTSFFSQASALRIVWGGDNTVSEIRKIPLPPHSRDIGFPNKWSLSVFRAQGILQADDETISRLVHAYANDTYWFGQMACSSPRGMLWLGSQADIATASEKFWSTLDAHLMTQALDLSAVDVMNKRVLEDQSAVAAQAVIRVSKNNVVNVIRFKSVAEFLVADHCGSGVFYEAIIESLASLSGIMNRKLQTIVSYGIASEDWDKVLRAHVFAGIDRIVDVGEALNFSAEWDGLDLMTEYTRGIALNVS